MGLKLQLDALLAHIQLVQVIFNTIAQIRRSHGGKGKSHAGFLWLAGRLQQAEDGAVAILCKLPRHQDNVLIAELNPSWPQGVARAYPDRRLYPGL